MLTCFPQSFCTWNFRVLGASAGAASLAFNFFTEQGSILLGPTEFVVLKHGPLSGHWTLERNGEIVAEARKPSAMFRSFELSGKVFNLTVKAESAVTRCFDIFSDNQVVGNIRPAHMFTRRAIVECSSDVPELA